MLPAPKLTHLASLAIRTASYRLACGTGPRNRTESVGFGGQPVTITSSGASSGWTRGFEPLRAASQAAGSTTSPCAHIRTGGLNGIRTRSSRIPTECSIQANSEPLEPSPGIEPGLVGYKPTRSPRHSGTKLVPRRGVEPPLARVAHLLDQHSLLYGRYSSAHDRFSHDYGANNWRARRDLNPQLLGYEPSGLPLDLRTHETAPRATESLTVICQFSARLILAAPTGFEPAVYSVTSCRGRPLLYGARTCCCRRLGCELPWDLRREARQPSSVLPAIGLTAGCRAHVRPRLELDDGVLGGRLHDRVPTLRENGSDVNRYGIGRLVAGAGFEPAMAGL